MELEESEGVDVALLSRLGIASRPFDGEAEGVGETARCSGEPGVLDGRLGSSSGVGVAISAASLV